MCPLGLSGQKIRKARTRLSRVRAVPHWYTDGPAITGLRCTTDLGLTMEDDNPATPMSQSAAVVVSRNLRQGIMRNLIFLSFLFHELIRRQPNEAVVVANKCRSRAVAAPERSDRLTRGYIKGKLSLKFVSCVSM